MKLFLPPFFDEGAPIRTPGESKKLRKMVNERSLNLNHWSSTPQRLTLLESLVVPWHLDNS